MDQIPFNFTTIALVIFGVTMILGAIRGVVRMFFGLIALALAVIAAYIVWLKMPEVSAALENPLSPRVMTYTSIGVGLLVFAVTRWIMGLIARPFVGGDRPRGAGLFGAFLGLIPAGGLVWVAAASLRMIGAAETISHTDEKVNVEEGGKKPIAFWSRKIQEIVEGDPLANLLSDLDPFLDKGSAALSQLLISTTDQSAVESLNLDQKTAEVLNHPKIRELMNDPEIQELLARKDISSLLQNKKVAEVAQESGLDQKLTTGKIEETIDRALFEQNQRRQPRFRLFQRRKDPDE